MAKAGPGNKRLEQAPLGHADEPTALAKAFPDDRNHEGPLGEYGERHDHQEDQELLQARHDRRADPECDGPDGQDQVSLKRLQEPTLPHPPPELGRHVALTAKTTQTLPAATISDVWADLQDLGLRYASHASAGRLPTAARLRLSVNGMREVGNVSEEEGESIEARCAAVGRSMNA